MSRRWNSFDVSFFEKIKAVQVHYLIPDGEEVLNESLLRIIACVHLCDGAELRVRSENEIDNGCCPLKLARMPVPTFEHVRGLFGLRPLRTHVEQVDEEVVCQS